MDFLSVGVRSPSTITSTLETTLVELLLGGLAVILGFLALTNGSIADAMWRPLGQGVSHLRTSKRTLRGQEYIRDDSVTFLSEHFPQVEIVAEWALSPRGLGVSDLFVFYDRTMFGISTAVTPETIETAEDRAWGYEPAVRKASRGLLRAKLNYVRSRESSVRFFNGSLARLVRHKAVRSIELEREVLALWLQKTSYFTFVCTNETLEEIASDNRPLARSNAITDGSDSLAASAQLRDAREAMYRCLTQAGPVIAQERYLANTLAINVNVITKDRQLIYVVRSGSVARKPGFFSVSVSGTMDLSPNQAGTAVGDWDGDGVPDPFRTAVRETWEELNLSVERKQVTFLALCRVRESRQPFLVGEIAVSKTWQELLSDSPLARDRFEWGQLQRLDLGEMRTTIDKLLTDQANWGRPSIVGVLLSCMRHVPDQALMQYLRLALRSHDTLGNGS